jgi:hypothetical protein
LADQRISQLPALSQAAVASGDLLPIADISASQTKKIKVADLINAGIALVPSGTIDLGLLNQGSTTKIGTSGVADDAITAAKLANDSSIAVQTTAPSGDNFEGRGFFHSSTGNLQVFNGSSYQQVVLGASGIADGAVTAAKIASGTITTGQISSSGLATAAYADGSVTAVKIASGTITAGQIASGTITAGQIAGGAITATQLAASGITYDRIQAVSSGDTLLGRSASTSGTIQEIPCTAAGRALLDDANAAAQRATLGLGNIALASGSWTDGSSFSGTSTGTNTGDQTITLTNDVTGTGSGTFTATIASGAVSSGKIADGAVITAKIADGAITANKLDDDSTVVVASAAPAGSGSFIGQQHINTSTGFEYTWTGSEWQRLHGIATIAFSGVAPLTFSGSYPDNFSAEIAVTVAPQVAATFWGGPVSGSNAAASFRAIASTDLPLATSGTAGISRPGTGLVVASGVLNHSNSISGQTINGLTIDNQGHIQDARALQAEDIPALDASKIATGAFPTALIADNAITGDKLSDYSTALIGETTPVAQFIGQLFFNPLDGAFYMWDANVWRPIGISVGEIVFAGTYDASVNQVESVTAAGTGAGLVAGSGLPAASEGNSSYYVVVSASGTGISPAPSGTLVPPDLILSDGTAWKEIDVSSSYGNQTASSIAFVPSGSLSSTNVQTAIEELLDSTFSTDSGPMGGFRNAIINGNFIVWQRGASHSTLGYGSADRWGNFFTGSSSTMSLQTFTVGQTTVPGDPVYFCRMAVTSSAGVNNFVNLAQRIDDVRTFANRQVTISFWAKADATKDIAIELEQFFGTGGSPSSPVNNIGTVKKTLTTSWQKITHTVSVPSISGKTLGDGGSFLGFQIWLDAGSSYNGRTNTLGQQSGTFDIAQVQIEPGPIATTFENRTPTMELLLCQRYYERSWYAIPTSGFVALGNWTVNKRVFPTISIVSYSTGSGGSVGPLDGKGFVAATYATTDARVLIAGDAEL